MILLRQYRQSKKLTQKQLAEMSGIPQQTISAIESGSRPNPGVQTLRPIADKLGCTIDELCKTIAEKG